MRKWVYEDETLVNEEKEMGTYEIEWNAIVYQAEFISIDYKQVLLLKQRK